jgi:hypothetical protein
MIVSQQSAEPLPALHRVCPIEFAGGGTGDKTVAEALVVLLEW